MKIKHRFGMAICVVITLFVAADGTAESRRRSSVMKRRLASQTTTVAGQDYGMAGCGLGSVLFGPKTGFIQVIAGTSNLLAGNQTFAITSGTSNCRGEDTQESAENFIEINKESLAKDISRGGGETLDNLAAIYGCDELEPLGSVLQSKYAEIFPEEVATPARIHEKISAAIEADSRLAETCL